MPLQQKENRNLPSRKQPFRINTLTNDVSEVLRAINSNVAWKNCSGKLTKTVGKTSNPRNPKKNHMTEDDIDKLFEHGQNEKDNSRRDARQHPKDGIHEVYFGMEKMEVLLQSQLLKEENKRKLMDKSFEKQQEAQNKIGQLDQRHQEADHRYYDEEDRHNKADNTLHQVEHRHHYFDEIYAKKDFANSVQFLKMDDEYDKLLDGLPTGASEEIAHKGNANSDLTANFKKDYMVGKIVGQGAYASVRVAVYRPSNLKVAIKVYEKNLIREPQRKKSVRRQIRILQQLSHRNIVQIYDVVETNNHLNIVMEYLSGIALSTYLKNQANHRATEHDSKIIIQGLAEGLCYLHAKNIAHRDIKLQNVILDEELAPKLIDFGFSTCISPQRKVRIFCGTPSYMAPEIVQKKEYRGEPADIWALGVLIFVTTTGVFPFKGATDQELYRKINAAEYPRGQLLFCKDLADLISKMLKIDPDQRLTASEVIEHVWLKGEERRKNTDNELKKKEKETKKSSQFSKCRKRTTISSHKSKEKGSHSRKPTEIGFENRRPIDLECNKLTQTCHQNLRLQLRALRQSPFKLNNTCTQRKMHKELKAVRLGNNSRHDKDKSCLASGRNDNKFGKTNSKVLELLTIGLRKRPEEKSKSRTKRF